MAFTPTYISSPLTSTTVLVTDNTFLGFEPEVNLFAQAIAEAKEQLHQAMEVKQEEGFWWWLENSWEEQMSEWDLVVKFIDKKVVVAVMFGDLEAVVESKCQISSIFIFRS